MFKKIIKIFTITIFLLILVLFLAYGVSQSNFRNLKKYDENNNINDVRDALRVPSKEKKKLAEERYYTTTVRIKQGGMANLGDFTMNISGNRKLTANISLKYKNNNKNNNWLIGKNVEDEIMGKGDVLRSAVINVISNSDNARVTNKDMKKELIKSMNKYLSDGKIEEVYYNRFIIQ